MNYRLTIGLLVVMVALGAFLYATEMRSEPKKESVPTQILTFRADEISSLSVTYQGKTTELKRDDSRWMMKRPEQAEAQGYLVDGLLARISPLNASRALSGAVEPLSTYGLEKPQLEAEFRTTRNDIAVLQVGDNTPDGSSFYVKRRDSDQVYVVYSTPISEVARLATNPPKATPTPTPLPGAAPATGPVGPVSPVSPVSPVTPVDTPTPAPKPGG